MERLRPIRVQTCIGLRSLRYHRPMASLLKTRVFGRSIEDLPSVVTDHLPSARRQTMVLRSIGWGAAGAGALTLGLVIGRELRKRYKFNRRTPYDFYAHSGEHDGDLEFGVGI